MPATPIDFKPEPDVSLGFVELGVGVDGALMAGSPCCTCAIAALIRQAKTMVIEPDTADNVFIGSLRLYPGLEHAQCTVFQHGVPRMYTAIHCNVNSPGQQVDATQSKPEIKVCIRVADTDRHHGSC